MGYPLQYSGLENSTILLCDGDSLVSLFMALRPESPGRGSAAQPQLQGLTKMDVTSSPIILKAFQLF